MRAEFIRDDRGFSLLEVLIASSILTVGLVSLAQLLAVAVTANAAAGRATYAALLAAQKIEDLRSTTWESLEGNTGEFVEYLDRAGRTLEGARASAVYTRRWSVAPLSADPKNTRVVQVLVHTPHGDMRIATARTRTAP